MFTVSPNPSRIPSFIFFWLCCLSGSAFGSAARSTYMESTPEGLPSSINYSNAFVFLCYFTTAYSTIDYHDFVFDGPQSVSPAWRHTHPASTYDWIPSCFARRQKETSSPIPTLFGVKNPYHPRSDRGLRSSPHLPSSIAFCMS